MSSSSDATTAFRLPPERHIAVDSGEVAYRRFGQGPDVLFVHGWPVSGATYRHLVDHLAHRVTCHVIDLPGAGDSRFGPGAPMSIDGHVTAVRQVVDALALTDYAVVGHDSGGLIARHAVAGDPRLRGLGLIDTEQLRLTWRFKQFVAAGRLPAYGKVLAWVAGRRRLRRHPLLLGGAFTDPALLDGEFDTFFLEPLRRIPERRAAAQAVVRTFERRHVDRLAELHRAIDVPVQLVWGEDDAFFPVAWAEEMLPTFADARLAVIPGTRLFSHEEKPAEVAAALLPVLEGSARPAA